MLDVEQLDAFGRDGQLTVPISLVQKRSTALSVDLEQWDKEFRSTLTDEVREWYLEEQDSDPASPFRKLDDPFFIGQRFEHWPVYPGVGGGSGAIDHEGEDRVF